MSGKGMVGSTAISEMQAIWNLQFQYVSIIVRLENLFYLQCDQ